MCAMKAGMNRKTAGKYLSQDNVLEQQRETRTRKTRKASPDGKANADPLEFVYVSRHRSAADDFEA
jgi:hypothetical protein